jgi:hypothetical protein
VPRPSTCPVLAGSASAAPCSGRRFINQCVRYGVTGRPPNPLPATRRKAARRACPSASSGARYEHADATHALALLRALQLAMRPRPRLISNSLEEGRCANVISSRRSSHWIAASQWRLRRQRLRRGTDRKGYRRTASWHGHRHPHADAQVRTECRSAKGGLPRDPRTRRGGRLHAQEADGRHGSKRVPTSVLK